MTDFRETTARSGLRRDGGPSQAARDAAGGPGIPPSGSPGRGSAVRRRRSPGTCVEAIIRGSYP